MKEGGEREGDREREKEREREREKERKREREGGRERRLNWTYAQLEDVSEMESVAFHVLEFPSSSLPSQ